MIDKDARDAMLLARELASKLFAFSRDSKENICAVPAIDLKTMARTAHSIAEILKP